MEKDQLRAIIKEVLQWLRTIPYSDDAVELLMLTADRESALGHYICQPGGGPGLGIFQMDTETERDIWHNFLRSRPGLQETVYKTITPLSPFSALEFNLAYQIIMARIYYYRVTEPIPDKEDIKGMAGYYERHYKKGKGRVIAKEAESEYRRLCL